MSKKILKKGIVTPAGTVFDDAPIITQRHGECVAAVFGLTPDTSGNIEYYLDDDDALLEWFEDGEIE